ncbi:hypothetical protein ACLOJK_031414 [Asimina triloba]
MSKTLGNVIDPLDSIREYGADALRFTLALGTAGQDLNLSSERLTSSKAFTNKLWNAGKFVLQNLPRQTESAAWKNILIHKFLAKRLAQDKVGKLHELIDRVTSSYDKYIEASKTRVHGSENRCKAQAVLLYVFENVLKLLHPFMPFVTEELWQALPHREQALIVSQWPKTSLPRDSKSVKNFENLQALIKAIRNARAEYSVKPAKRISASIVASPDVLLYISQSVHLVAGEGLEAYLPLADMVDISAEVHRLSKRLSKMQMEYDALVARLSSKSVQHTFGPVHVSFRNSSCCLDTLIQAICLIAIFHCPQFVSNAPEEVVRNVQEKAAEAEEKISLTKNRLSFLESTVLVSEKPISAA